MPTQCEIQTCINNLTCSSDLTEMVVLAAETNDITVDRSIPVANVNSLPDLATSGISVGTVFFVQSLSIPVVAGLGSWVTLDNRIVRQDYTLSELYSWGQNSSGQLGDNTITDRSSPVSVVGDFTDWCQVSAGGSHSLALITNGTAWGWGSNQYGKLGDNTTVSKRSPVSVVGGFTDWSQVSAGYAQSLAVRTSGTAWAWGRNNVGQLGDNTTVSKSSPVSVIGGFTDWCQISTGCVHSLAVRTNGTAWAWGCNGQGRLGDNTTVAKSSPVSVIGGFCDWSRVSAGKIHSIGLRTNGTAWAWGYNFQGPLGDNTTTAKSSPVSVVGGFTDWCQVSAGYYDSLAVRTNGSAWSWGLNNSGALGDNSTSARSSPVSVVGGFTDWCHISAGKYSSLAVRTNGTAWAWGLNCCGKLGDNTTVAKSSPISVIGGFTDWSRVSAGLNHSLGVRTLPTF
jgi:alpha-tubulin suppressor-like RCC1 family protein